MRDVQDENGSADGEGMHFTVHDELSGPFVPGPLPTPMGEDGLPRHDIERHDQGAAPPFTYDMVICVEDDREYVEMFLDEEGVPDLLPSQLPVALRHRYDVEGAAVERRTFEPELVGRRFGHLFAKVGAQYVPVRPRRERCIHYRRQVFAMTGRQPGEIGHLDVHRFCTAKRSNAGSFLALNNEAVYACDVREPADPRSSGVQDLIDARKLRRRDHLRMIPMFGQPGEERQLDEDPYAGGIAGIFERQTNGG